VAGKNLITKINLSVAKWFSIGFGKDQNGVIDGSGIRYGENSYNHIMLIDATSSNLNWLTDALSISTDYYFAIVLRNSGCYTFIKGGAFSNWVLLGFVSGEATGTLYPQIESYNSTFVADNIRIPTLPYLPTPIAYDSFNRANGALGNTEIVGPDSQVTPSLAWNGTSGTILTNKAVITPSLGSELIINGNMSSDEPPGTAWTRGTGWTITGGVANASNLYTSLLQTPSISSGDWVQISLDASISGGTFRTFLGGSGVTVPDIANSGVNIIRTGKVSGTALAGVQPGGFIGTIDNFSEKKLTLSSLFASILSPTQDVIIDANISAMTTGTQAGLVLNLDSTLSPANFVIAYHTGTAIMLEKCIAGVYTTLINVANTFVANATLRVIKDDRKYRLYYNNAFIGTEQTISDAGIINNKNHGLFSTYSGNTFDNFSVFPRGTGNEYSMLYTIDGATPPDVAWYWADGMSGSLGAWQSKGVASIAASYSNLITPGTFDLSVVSLPAWDTTNGWKMNGNGLNTGIIPATGYSMIILATEVGGGNDTCLAGENTTSRFSIFNHQSGVNKGFFASGNKEVAGYPTGTYTLCIAGQQCYYNGVAIGTIPGTMGTAGAQIRIGSENGSFGCTANIKAVKISSGTWTPSAVLALHNKMIAL
jgi:hypothetical protein